MPSSSPLVAQSQFPTWRCHGQQARAARAGLLPSQCSVRGLLVHAPWPAVPYRPMASGSQRRLPIDLGPRLKGAGMERRYGGVWGHPARIPSPEQTTSVSQSGVSGQSGSSTPASLDPILAHRSYPPQHLQSVKNSPQILAAKAWSFNGQTDHPQHPPALGVRPSSEHDPPTLRQEEQDSTPSGPPRRLLASRLAQLSREAEPGPPPRNTKWDA